MLYRFQNGEEPRDVRLVDPLREVVVTDPGEIDWTHFPVIDALEAVTRDELRQLRSLLQADGLHTDGLHTDGLRADAAPSPAPPTPPFGISWGLELLRAPLQEGGDSAPDA
ncbi:hypothetical protein A7982_13099 [Minicystis rosea]|nr:hypothetical protein A7982_13099 [Minicystis rosea]